MRSAMGYGPNMKSNLTSQIGWSGDIAVVATANSLPLVAAGEWLLLGVCQSFLDYRIILVTGRFWESWTVDPSGSQVLKLVDSGYLGDRDHVRKGRWVNHVKLGRTRFVVTAQAVEVVQIERRVEAAGSDAGKPWRARNRPRRGSMLHRQSKFLAVVITAGLVAFLVAYAAGSSIDGMCGT